MRHETPVENPGSWIILWKYWDFEWIRSALRAFKRWSHNRLKKVCKAVGRAPVWQCYNAKDIPNGVQFWFTLLHMDEFHLHKKKMHLDSKLFPRPRKQTWNQTLSSPGTKPRLGLNFLWFTGVSMEIPHMSIKSPQKWCTHQWGNKKSSWAIHTFQTFTFQEILLSARQNRSTKSPNEEGASVTG
jgi:hypothetical protein